MDLESYFISHIYTDYIGDDGAILDDNCIISKDAFFEDVHFKREWMSLKEIAKKAIAVNISDAYAMGAKPVYALLVVAMPRDTIKKEAKELAEGFNEACRHYGVKIIGGDTIANTKLDITVTIVSRTKKPIKRSTIKQNHLLAYTGNLGSVQKDLKKLLKGKKVSKKSKFKNVKLRKKFIFGAKRFIKGGMDISDGLFSDLEKLSKESRIGFEFLKKIDKSIGCSGEEYEFLFGFDKRDKKAIIARAKQTKTPVTIFAKATRKRYKNICGSHHF